jgi:hypothetical protein
MRVLHVGSGAQAKHGRPAGGARQHSSIAAMEMESCSFCVESASDAAPARHQLKLGNEVVSPSPRYGVCTGFLCQRAGGPGGGPSAPRRLGANAMEGTAI